MSRMNKTKSNLEIIWNQLDDASGSLYNALTNISSMSGIPKDIEDVIAMIDLSAIDSLKDKIEELIKDK